MRRKKMTPEEREKMMSVLQIPPGSTIPDRLIKVIQHTSLSYRGLLEKWLHQEEASIEAAKLAGEEILKRAEARVAALEKKVLRLEGKTVRAEDPEKAQDRKMLVSQALSLRKAGKTYKQIAELFNEEKAPTISGRGKWSPSMVIHLLDDKKKQAQRECA
jgi:hypothetical protein